MMEGGRGRLELEVREWLRHWHDEGMLASRNV